MTQPEAASVPSLNSGNGQQSSTSTNAVPITTTNTPNTTSTADEILYSAFRQKTIDMKHWVPLPESTPSVRRD